MALTTALLRENDVTATMTAGLLRENDVTSSRQQDLPCLDVTSQVEAFWRVYGPSGAGVRLPGQFCIVHVGRFQAVNGDPVGTVAQLYLEGFVLPL